MYDIEDVGDVSRIAKTNSDLYFNIKVRSKNLRKSAKDYFKNNINKSLIEKDNCVAQDYKSTNLLTEDNCCSKNANLIECCTLLNNFNKEEHIISDSKSNDYFFANEQSVLPWQKLIYLKTWGCSHNNSDSEYMAGLLIKSGYTITKDQSNAELWLLNSCTVKTPSETQLLNQIKQAQKNGIRVVVAGCVSQAAPNEPWLKNISIVGVQQIDRVVEVVEETLKGNIVRLLSSRQKKSNGNLKLDLPKMRRNEFIEILAINSGCLNHCTYCKTKQARGDLRSFQLESLVERAKHALINEKCKELWLTSEDLGAWGRDLGMVLPDLLNELIKIIPEGCMMRLGMTNPPYILDYLEEIAQILRHPRVYSFLHIPVQSGSDAVLNEMQREYTNKHFCQIVDYMQEHVPNVYIATDFICAFPTETKEDFEESLNLIKKYKFPSLFINQYYPRSNTPAARLKKIETKEARRRTGKMTELFHSYSRYSSDRIGQKERVLICEMATDKLHYVGHNKSYEHILVESFQLPKSLLGMWAEVQITEVSKFFMKAKVLNYKQSKKNLRICDLIFMLSEIQNKYMKNANLLIKILFISQILFLFYYFVKFVIIKFFI